ncbi:MAG: hypothetical protein ACUVQP_07520, partial [Bacteroidales bacterium]
MKNKILNYILVVAGLIFAILFLFYPMFISQFNLLPGDIGDERLILYILNHWYNVFKGNETFFQLNMLYPASHVLGYSESFFIFGIIYSFFIFIGFNYFSSLQLLYIFVVCIGYFSAFFFLRKVFNIDFFLSVVGAIFFVSLNALQNQFGHAQLLGFYFYPLLGFLVFKYFKSVSINKKSSWFYIICFSVLFALFFFTSFYPAWFFLLSIILISMNYMVIKVLERSFKKTVSNYYRFVKTICIQLFSGLAVFMISFIPFLINYLPVVLSGNKFKFSEVLFYSPYFKDIINVGGSNYLWSPLLNYFHFNFRNIEVSSGYTFFFLACFLLMYFFTPRCKLNEKDKFLFSIATTSIIIFVLIVKITSYFSLWYFVYQIVPGAKAIRALGRALIVSQIFAALFVIYTLNTIYLALQQINLSVMKKYSLILIMFLIPSLLILEQANKGYFHLNKISQITLLGKINRNDQCKVFFIEQIAELSKPAFSYQTDALMASMKLGIPTINGYSGIMPKNWNLHDPSSPFYNYYVYKWIKSNYGTENVCKLNLETGSMKVIDALDLKQDA